MHVLLFVAACGLARPAPRPDVTLSFTGVSDPTPAQLGVISGPTSPPGSPVQDLSARLKEYGITRIRNNDYYDDRLDIEGIFNCGGNTYPSWTGCDPADARRYQWDKSDALVKAIEKGNFDLMLRLGGEWENEGRRHDFKGPQDAQMEDAWIVAARTVARRYRTHYTYLNIWTEWPGKHFWDRPGDAFPPFWAKAFKALKQEFPDKKIGGPGLVALSTMEVIQGRSGSAVRFLSGLAQAGVRPDWLGWHAFSNDPHTVHKAALAFRELLEARGVWSNQPWKGRFHGVELVLDAVGTSDVDDSTLPPVKLEAAAKNEIHNGARGAAFLAGMMIALEASDTNLAYWYRASDGRSDPQSPIGQRGQGREGLFYGDATATPKPTAHAARLWATMSARYPVRKAVSIPAGQGIWALLAADSAGRQAVLVANNSDRALTWAPEGLDLKDATTWTVDGKDDGSTPVVRSGARTVPAWGVQLVELK